MHSERLLEHFRNLRRAGAVEPPSADIRVENMACGDRLRLTVRVEGGLVTDAAFQAQGCTASIGCGSALAGEKWGQTPNAPFHETPQRQSHPYGHRSTWERTKIICFLSLQKQKRDPGGIARERPQPGERWVAVGSH